MASYPITILIPTACTTQRADTLRNAIASIQAAGPGIAKILIAANGPKADPQLLAELRERQDLHFTYFEEGSSPKALYLALPLVDTEFFGFLDDDDELLPGSLTRRLVTLQQTSTADILLSNGYLRNNGIDKPCLSHIDKVPNEPLDLFFMENWLPSCGALFRTASVGVAYFEDYHPYAEWSWLAFRLAMDQKRFCVLNEPTFRVHADTPASLSKSSEYRKTYVSLYRKMLNLNPPPKIQKILKNRLSQAQHDLSAWLLGEGDIRSAFFHHWLSLQAPYGLRFLPYTRHIIVAALKW